MGNKYNLSSITKLLEKLFKAGFNTEKDILAIQLDDLQKIQDITPIEITIIINNNININAYIDRKNFGENGFSLSTKDENVLYLIKE